MRGILGDSRRKKHFAETRTLPPNSEQLATGLWPPSVLPIEVRQPGWLRNGTNSLLRFLESKGQETGPGCLGLEFGSHAGS